MTNSYKENRGYIGIAMYQPKTSPNWGVLMRSAYCLGADFACTIENRYPYSAGDVVKSHRNIPYFHFESWNQFMESKPPNCDLVAVERVQESRRLETFKHPKRAIYILGGEDITIPHKILNQCQYVVEFTSKFCLNVSMAGTVVLYDRQLKNETRNQN